MRATTTMMMMTGTLFALGLALSAAGGAGQSAVMASAARTAGVAPAPWIQEDPGAKAYQAAREALNARRYDEAARLFAELRSRHARSGYVADAYYYEAFARSRGTGRSELQRALELLAQQRAQFPSAGTARDSDQLRVRIEAQLARQGDARAAESIAQQAAASRCGPEQEVRTAALSALLNMNAEAALPILREVLQTRDECSADLRKKAVFLISQHMDDEAVDILLDLAHRKPDPDLEVREQAVFWLSQVNSEEALAALEAILAETDDPKIQERAVFAVSQHGSPRAAEILMKLAERPGASREVREQAIFWIGQNPRSGGVRYLLDLYPKLDEPELKERAVFAISQTDTEESRRWLLERLRDPSETVEVRKMALFWAGQAKGVSVADLQGLYGSLPDAEMREQVIFVVSQRREAQAVDFLMEVARTEKDPELRNRAIFWLGQSKDPRVGEFLLSLIRR
ncbi:MAG: HEAT repeat domain-containing protein [Longimicrobiales bacterium]